MKWFDLEVGDVIRTTEAVNKSFCGYDWTIKDLTISEINFDKSYGGRETICVSCDDNYYYFELYENGRQVNYEHLNEFFEIVSLKED